MTRAVDRGTSSTPALAACALALACAPPTSPTPPRAQLGAGVEASTPRPSTDPAAPDPDPAPTAPAFGPGDPTSSIVLDGDTREWPASLWATHDHDHVYLRLQPAGAPWTLQAGSVTTAIWIDVDSDARTGLPVAGVPELGAIGVDLTIELSPRTGKLAPAHGVAVARVGADGRAREHSHADIGFSFAPTHAAPSYEARIRRRPAGQPALAGPVRGLITTLDRRGAPGAWKQPFSVDLGDLPPARPPAAALPARAHGSLRVVSYNVLRASPRSRPEPFARVLGALAPDVVLVQEWDGFDARALHGWMTEHVPAPRGDWYTHSLPSAGVALVSAHPIERALDLRLPRGQGGGRLRLVAAIVKTPLGRGLFASLHLKCCGTLRSPEDAQRVAETSTIHERLSALQREHAVDFVVVGGDFNLVGSRDPLDVLAAPLDARLGGLQVALPLVLGDGACHTWRGADKPFSPGRLDYVLASERALVPARAFIVDTRALAPAALEARGLFAGDPDASDHLPVVVDLTRR